MWAISRAQQLVESDLKCSSTLLVRFFIFSLKSNIIIVHISLAIVNLVKPSCTVTLPLGVILSCDCHNDNVGVSFIIKPTYRSGYQQDCVQLGDHGNS